jgi:GMP synthase (glutamine-hydrolysing)
MDLERIRALVLEGTILSGGPASIYENGSPRAGRGIFDLRVPILGICYGMQYMVDSLGGEVISAQKREYGFAELHIKDTTGIFDGIEKKTRCWMNHGDTIGKLPAGFKITASTPDTRVAATENRKKNFYGLQFHPEVVHTPEGKNVEEFPPADMWVQEKLDYEILC